MSKSFVLKVYFYFIFVSRNYVCAHNWHPSFTVGCQPKEPGLTSGIQRSKTAHVSSPPRSSWSLLSASWGKCCRGLLGAPGPGRNCAGRKTNMLTQKWQKSLASSARQKEGTIAPWSCDWPEPDENLKYPDTLGKSTHLCINLHKSASLPTQAAPRKNVKNDKDLKTSTRQAAWWEKKKSLQSGLWIERGNICGELTFFYSCSHLVFLYIYNPDRRSAQFSNFVKFWRVVVFPNISQRFDSISGMWSMTLVWNQRTTLENEGGGKKKNFSRRSHRCASINKLSGQ